MGGSDSFLESLQSYVRHHINSFYRELKRCRDHCDGRAFVQHRTTTPHDCDHRCAPHECRGLGARTVRHIHFLLSGAYNEAKRWKWVTDNPMGDAKPPAAPPPSPKPPTAQQAADLARQRISDDDLEVVLYRDPDGRGADGVDVRVFINGSPVDARLVVIDPGAGYALDDWEQDRDTTVQDASPAAAEVIAAFYDAGADTEFIHDPAGDVPSAG